MPNALAWAARLVMQGLRAPADMGNGASRLHAGYSMRGACWFCSSVSWARSEQFHSSKNKSAAHFEVAARLLARLPRKFVVAI
jgi:hypothetical protein